VSREPRLPTTDEIAARRAAILERIAGAAQRKGRDPASVALLAVTKTHPSEVVLSAARAGLTLFGENRVAEGAAKIQASRVEFPDLVWRLIGPLQTNKAKTALQWFSVVETLDRERLASRLEAILASEPSARRLPVLLELNVGGEATKSGARVQDVRSLAKAALACPHLDVRGLMTVPPFSEIPEAVRPHFRTLRETRDRLSQELGIEMPELSMGMSHDFEVAVEEGSTEIRIGTALFGERDAR
jgi:pyridoxal phosphate enzyme (YggS family)